MSATKVKPLYLMDVFSQLTDEQHRLTVPQIVEELEKRGVLAERKGIYRDIEALIEYGLDIRRTGTGYYLHTRQFDRGEVQVLISAVEAASFLSAKRSGMLIEKLGTLLGDYDRDQLIVGSLGGIKSRDDSVLKTIEAVSRAIAHRRVITFQYSKRDVGRNSIMQHSGKRYRVSPYALIWMQERYYLVCNMEDRNDLTHFRLDRIQDVWEDPAPWRHFSQVSAYGAKFDAADYTPKCLNMFGGEVMRIRLKCSISIVNEVFDRFGDEITVQSEGEDRFTAFVSAVGGVGFLSWAAQFGDQLEIVSPPELRQQMRRRLEAAIKAYN